MEDKKYYHFLPSLLRNGAIVENGNFGRLIYAGSNLQYREFSIEEIRKKLFSDKPSRLKSIFLLESIEDALTYKKHWELKTNKKYLDVLYKVKVLDINKSKHIGCSGILDLAYSKEDITLVDFNRACSYWRSEHAVLQYEQNKSEKFAIEILIESPVEILERVYLP